MFFTASHGTDRENLFKNLELHELKIISFIPLTVTFDSCMEKLDDDHCKHKRLFARLQYTALV